MDHVPEQRRDTAGSVLGGLAFLITHEIGAAVAVIGGLYTGFKTLAAAERLSVNSWSWSLYLIAGGTFIALAAVCRWRPR